MHIWQIQEAKAKLAQFVKEARFEPQIISRHGIPEIVAISIEKYEELMSQKENIVEFFKTSPLNGVNLEIERDRYFIREMDI